MTVEFELLVLVLMLLLFVWLVYLFVKEILTVGKFWVTMGFFAEGMAGSPLDECHGFVVFTSWLEGLGTPG